MPVLYARDIASKQASFLLNIALAHILLFAQFAESFAYDHAGIISPGRWEGKNEAGLNILRVVASLEQRLLANWLADSWFLPDLGKSSVAPKLDELSNRCGAVALVVVVQIRVECDSKFSQASTRSAAMVG